VTTPRPVAVAVAVVVVVALSGCGTVAQHTAPSSSRQRPAPTAHKPTAAAVPAAPPISPALKAQEQAIHRQVLAALHAPPPNNLPPGIPAYLRRATARVNRIVTADAAHPALAIEGASVRLALPAGRAIATLVGPGIPRAVAGKVVQQAPATFQLTFAGPRGSIPLSRSEFTIKDEFGQSHAPAITTLSGAAMPSTVRAGEKLTLVMKTILPIGNGQLQYRPLGVRVTKHDRPLVAWDFSVETV
jgi:hypothetical protein